MIYDMILIFKTMPTTYIIVLKVKKGDFSDDK